MSDHTNFRLYEVEINGYKTTMRLSDQQAAARGLTVEEPKAEPVKAPAKKAPAKKAAGKASQPSANKARTAANK